MSGMVNGEVCNVLLDSGADIAVIPDYLVEPNQLLHEFYLVRGIHGHLIYRQKAKVDLTVGGTTVTAGWQQLPPEGLMGNMLC